MPCVAKYTLFTVGTYWIPVVHFRRKQFPPMADHVHCFISFSCNKSAESASQLLCSI